MWRIMRYRAFRVLAVFALIWAFTYDIHSSGNDKPSTEGAMEVTRLPVSSQLEKVDLVRIVDGDTIEVEFGNGNIETVRLIGVNTPESVHPDEKKNSEEGILASEFLKAVFADKLIIYLQKDTSETDKYGRLLRYVWLEKPTDLYDVEEVANKMVNGVLLRNGVAEVATYEPDTKYVDVFESICKNR